MSVSRASFVLGALLTTAIVPSAAYAQDASATGDDLMALGKAALRNEISMRYDAGLALTQDDTVVSADSSRFMWASQAKVQCGVALGFLKSGTKDPVSVGKCANAYMRMQEAPLPPPPPPTSHCVQPIAGIVFFEWDSAIPPADAVQSVDAVAANYETCGWKAIVVTGHTDRSGSDAYNDRLSINRAEAIAQLLEGRGVSRTAMEVSGRGESENRVPTADGVREVQNRRVEVTVK